MDSAGLYAAHQLVACFETVLTELTPGPGAPPPPRPGRPRGVGPDSHFRVVYDMAMTLKFETMTSSLRTDKDSEEDLINN
jgi:hypothetical protein